jgi:hypothetical protein
VSNDIKIHQLAAILLGGSAFLTGLLLFLWSVFSQKTHPILLTAPAVCGAVAYALLRHLNSEESELMFPVVVGVPMLLSLIGIVVHGIKSRRS